MLITGILFWARKKMPALTGAIFGAAKGIIGALGTRTLFTTIAPQVARKPWFPLARAWCSLVLEL